MAEDFGVKVSQDGIDVRNATEDELLMTSGNNTLKISLAQKDSAVGSGATVNVAHGFSYRPLFLTFGKDNNSSFWGPISNVFFGTHTQNGLSRVDAMNVSTKNSSIHGTTMDVRTIIFADKLV
jgi:hypothetical protein